MSRARFSTWIETYERAWRTPGTDWLEYLFAPDATYSMGPFEPTVAGPGCDRGAVGAGARGAGRGVPHGVGDRCRGGGDTGVVRVEVWYGDPVTRHYRDLWIVRLDDQSRCSDVRGMAVLARAGTPGSGRLCALPPDKLAQPCPSRPSTSSATCRTCDRRAAVMHEMEQFAEPDHVPIVHWETGRFLATLVRALRSGAGARGRHRDRLLHIAHGADARSRQDRDTGARSRPGAASDRLPRGAGVKDRVEIVVGDAMESLESLSWSFDFISWTGRRPSTPATSRWPTEGGRARGAGRRQHADVGRRRTRRRLRGILVAREPRERAEVQRGLVSSERWLGRRAADRRRRSVRGTPLAAAGSGV